MAKDGTEVVDEDYFSTIPPQTVFVIAGRDDVVKTGNLRLYSFSPFIIVGKNILGQG